MQEMQMMNASPGIRNPAEVAKTFTSEAEFLKLASHECHVADAPARLLQKYGLSADPLAAKKTD